MGNIKNEITMQLTPCIPQPFRSGQDTALCFIVETEIQEIPVNGKVTVKYTLHWNRNCINSIEQTIR